MSDKIATDKEEKEKLLFCVFGADYYEPRILARTTTWAVSDKFLLQDISGVSVISRKCPPPVGVGHHEAAAAKGAKCSNSAAIGGQIAPRTTFVIEQQDLVAVSTFISARDGLTKK